MRKRHIIAAVSAAVSIPLFLTSCSGGEGGLAAQRCDQVALHIVQLREADPDASKGFGAHPQSLSQACQTSMSASHAECILAANNYSAVRNCGE